MPRGRLYNPTNFIRWFDNLQLAQAMNMTLIGMVRLLIDQATGTGTLMDYPVSGDIFWTSQYLYDSTNEVMIDIWAGLARQPVPIQLTTSTLTVGTATDLYAFDNTTIMVPSYVILNTAGTGGSSVNVDQKYWTSDATKLEQYSRNWRSQTPAQPKWFVLWDAMHIRCFPLPDQTYPFLLYGVPWPTELGTGTEDITADPMLKLAIAYKAAANVLEATRPDIADAYVKEHDEIMSQFRIRIRNSQTNNIRRLRPVGDTIGTDVTIAAAKGVIKIGKRLS